MVVTVSGRPTQPARPKSNWDAPPPLVGDVRVGVSDGTTESDYGNNQAMERTHVTTGTKAGDCILDEPYLAPSWYWPPVYTCLW